MNNAIACTLLAGAVLFASCNSRPDADEEVTTKSAEGTVTTPAGDSAERRGLALVRVVNAVPGSKALSVRAERDVPFDNVAYKSVTPYHAVRGNLVRFAVFPNPASSQVGDSTTGVAARMPSDSGALATNTEAMRDGERYTIFVVPDEEGRGVTMHLVHDAIERDSTKAQIRFVNAAARAGELDLTIQGETAPVFDNVNFGEEAGYKSVAPVSGQKISVRRDDGRTSVVSAKGLRKLEAGKSYTIVVAGLPGRWEVITFEDEVGAKPVVTAR